MYAGWGNPLQKNQIPGKGGELLQVTSSATPVQNRIDGFCYDAAGNLLSDTFHSYAYDAENRLTAVDGGATATYVYDAEGRRVRKTTGATSVDFLYDLGGQVITELSSSAAWNRGEVFAGGRHLATYKNAMTYFIHSDWLGTERYRMPMTGTAETYMSLPFGDALTPATGGSSPDHFTGKERDAESGLDYFGARYYGSAFGRFASPDPKMISRQRMRDPQQWNMYQYGRNNPITMVDPDGLEVTVAQELQKSYDHLMKSESFRNAIAPYQGKGNPDLTIQRGKLGNDPMEPNRHDLGATKTTIVQSSQNCSSATSCTPIPATLKNAAITIDDSVKEGKGKDQTEGVTAHEVSHANDAVTDPQGYMDENAREENKLHDDRSEEKRADQFSNDVRREVKQEDKQEKKAKKEKPE